MNNQVANDDVSAHARDGTPVVEQCLDELEPFLAKQRKQIAKEGCLRAISGTHLHVLFVLTSEGPLPMGRLAELLAVSMPNLSGIVDRMVTHGLVERLRDDDDRRLVVVRSTAAGREAVDEIDLVRRRYMARVLETLNPDEQQRALDVFRILHQALARLDAQA